MALLMLITMLLPPLLVLLVLLPLATAFKICSTADDGCEALSCSFATQSPDLRSRSSPPPTKSGAGAVLKMGVVLGRLHTIHKECLYGQSSPRKKNCTNFIWVFDFPLLSCNTRISSLTLVPAVAEIPNFRPSFLVLSAVVLWFFRRSLFFLSVVPFSYLCLLYLMCVILKVKNIKF